MTIKILDEIHHQICAEIDRIGNNNVIAGLHTGRMGQILFLAYYARFKNNKEITDLTNKYIDDFVNNLDEFVFYSSFSSGISGVLTCLNHLNAIDCIEIEIDEIQESIKQYIFNSLDCMLAQKNFDFLHGAIGIGLFSLHNIYYQKEVNNKILSELCKSKNENGKSCSWTMCIEIGVRYGEGICLSHGISSIIMYLCKLHRKGFLLGIVEDLISSAVEYVLENQNDHIIVGSFFPSVNKTLDGDNLKSRLAWCYGDIGIALALWNAGKVLNRQDLHDLAIRVFDFSADRINDDDTLVKDACFCHGASGIAQIFRRMYFETGKAKYLDSSTYWINRVINYYNQETERACFLFYANNEKHVMYDLLEGISGIGMSLLSSIDNSVECSKWDEMLLIS